MAAAVIDATSHYALGLKASNGPLHAAAARAFATAGGTAASYASEERAHGRSERRRATGGAAPVAARARLPGLKAFGRIQAERPPPNGKREAAPRHIPPSRAPRPAKPLAGTRAPSGNQN